MKIIETDPHAQDALLLMDELSTALEKITGNSGKGSFDPEDVCVPRAVFAIAYDGNGKAVGCGALRPVNSDTAEIKRMYASAKERGIGTEILHFLERKALELGYSCIWLETRLINSRAVAFYEKNGYRCIPNYGKYAGRVEAVCFEKCLHPYDIHSAFVAGDE